MSKTNPSHRDRVHALFVQHSPRIRGFILSLSPNIGRADDLLQETFLTVSAKSDDYLSGSNFVAWACAIARYKVLEEYKRSGKSPNLLSPEVIEAVCAANPTSADENVNSVMLALKTCLSALSPHARQAIELRYTRAHTATEIATILGWSTDSVYVILSRARGSLQKCINARLERGA
ncbi:sigma-70 family RNA polymerase sigma factor [Novipirellula aureliae]|uniref:sigma-70 family RNA polymerase sigma factor n=1 Tax=Novipirellula aureliae TaxID=2527966 RepID=UPI001E34AFD7|nr:sigma-70 family RNA polymerase sigma factor [Novipirellula aureliae]